MIWYRFLYADESCASGKEKIKWKIRHNAGMLDTYVVTLSENAGGLLEIISTVELMQRGYPKQELFIVGVAKGYESARDLACQIILEVYHKTGGFHVRKYLLGRHYTDSEQVNLCP